MWEDVDYEAIDQELTTEAIDAILSKLTERQKVVLTARFWLDMTYKEIGQTLKISAARASQIEHRALRILRSPENVKEFLKLGINWVNKIYEDNQKYLEEKKKKDLEERLEWERQRIIKHNQAVRDKIARKKLKVKYHDQPIPSMTVQQNERVHTYVVPQVPPHFVQLIDGPSPYLYVKPEYGSINRDLDPVTYDKWLAYLQSKKRQM